MNEFDIISRYFAPLSQGFAGALNLTDDAAVFDIPAGMELVVTNDAISEGIHFIGNEPPARIAQKLLRTNLSDLAAMGATPLCYFLTLMLPKTADEAFIKNFAEGLERDQQTFGIHLAGGDTIRTNAQFTCAITAHGLVPKVQALQRSGAKAGDIIYTSGTLGDAALGLLCHSADRASDSAESHEILRRHKRVSQDDEHYLINRYQLPQPRLALGQALRGIANACMDISDGLLQDLGHICAASNVGAEIHLEQLPLSPAARAMVEQDADLWPYIYAGGDDYELLFTAPADTKIKNATAIGKVHSGSGIILMHNGKKIAPVRLGYMHSV